MPKDVYDVFSIFGKIDSLELKTASSCICLGYGYVYFEKEEGNEAIEKMDGSKDNVIKISLFKPKNERMENAGNQNIYLKIIVKKFSNGMDSKNLKIFLIFMDI